MGVVIKLNNEGINKTLMDLLGKAEVATKEERQQDAYALMEKINRLFLKYKDYLSSRCGPGAKDKVLKEAKDYMWEILSSQLYKESEMRRDREYVGRF